VVVATKFGLGLKRTSSSPRSLRLDGQIASTQHLPPTDLSWGSCTAGANGMLVGDQTLLSNRPVRRGLLNGDGLENTGWVAQGQQPCGPRFRTNWPPGRSCDGVDHVVDHIAFCQATSRSRSGSRQRCDPERRLSMIGQWALSCMRLRGGKAGLWRRTESGERPPPTSPRFTAER